MTAMALAVAGGGTITRWAKENNVSRRTCYGWSESGEFKKIVDRIRERALDSEAGKLKNLDRAMAEMARLVKTGENGMTRLAASKAIAATMIELRNHATANRNWAELMARVKALEGNDANAN